MITPNIDEEASMMEDVGMQDVHFNEVSAPASVVFQLLEYLRIYCLPCQYIKQMLFSLRLLLTYFV